MTRIHSLDARIGHGSLNIALRCPYDDEPATALASYPDWMVPICRPAGEPSCLAADAVAAGHLLSIWGGPDAVLTSGMAVEIWRTDDGIRLAAATTRTAPVEQIARDLARASRSPRYEGGKWTMLFDAPSNVDHAWREAIRHNVDTTTADLWRKQLLDWHFTPEGTSEHDGASQLVRHPQKN